MAAPTAAPAGWTAGGAYLTSLNADAEGGEVRDLVHHDRFTVGAYAAIP